MRTEADLREGLQHIASLTRKRLNVRIPVEDPRIVEALDVFENRWFPIAGVTLLRHFPHIGELLFLNLVQTEGVEVAVSVSTFVERLDDMAAGTGLYGADGPRAREFLERRGLTDARVAEAKELLAKLGTFREEILSDPTPEDRQAAEDALWAWYLEWGGIARVAIRDRRLLRLLGFLQTQRGGSEEEVEEVGDGFGPADESGVAEPVAPAPAPGAAGAQSDSRVVGV